MKHRFALDQILGSNPFSGVEVIELLARQPELKDLYATDSGVLEGYTIREHTVRVYEIFSQQLPYFYEPLAQIAKVDAVRLLKFVLALHDIGKPLAIRAEGKHFQHDYTLPILQQQMEYFGFTVEEVQLARALIGHDELGKFLKGRSTLEEGVEKITSVVQQSGLCPSEFMHLQVFYYTVDAGSYRFLRKSVFTEEDGPMRPRDPRFVDLLGRILSSR